ncbi:MAG TPA: glutamate racemase, partial [Candidatus Paceibacterota bacterium]
SKNSKSDKPIGVFDSGVGGLSVLKEIKKILPNENFVFLADQLYVPYGEKTKKQLIDRCVKITDFFIKNHDIKMMVVACNTATCGAINELRGKYAFPIVGTVPAVKPASLMTKSGTIGVISTPSTSKSIMLKNIIKEDCKGINILNIGCKNLENAVEEGDLYSPKVKKLMQKYLKAVSESKADYLVLGCTHYPFLREPISKILRPGIKLLDSGGAIAKRTKVLLTAKNMKNKERVKGKTAYFTTGKSAKFSKVASTLLKAKIGSKTVKI